MRIATWNVNSLKARMEKVQWWLERARPDVLLMQETKLKDQDAPLLLFRAAGYELAHHGEGGRNGVAIASRHGVDAVLTNFGEPLRPRSDDADEADTLADARMIAADCGGVRVISLYAPNGRTLDSPFYEAKLVWFERLLRWLQESADPGKPLVLGGDFNVAPEDDDVWDPLACHGGTHVSAREREAFSKLLRWGLVDTYRHHHPDKRSYTWWDYRAGRFQKNFGMRIVHLLATRPLAERALWAEIDRIIMDELVRGVFTPEAVACFQRAMGRMKQSGCDAVVLGCTEIPLLMNDSNSPLPTLDSTRLLARAALRRAVSRPAG